MENKKEVNIGTFIPDILGQELARYTEQFLFSNSLNPIRYKKKVVDRWISLPYPAMVSDWCYECGHNNKTFVIKWFPLLRFGKKTIEVPVYKKVGGVLKIPKLSDLYGSK